MTIFNIIVFLILVLLAIFCLVYFLTPLFSKVPFVPCSKEVVYEIVHALPLSSGSVFFDLGCGDGRVLFAIAKAYPSVSCRGVEIAPFPFLLAKARKVFSWAHNVSIMYGDFFKIDTSSASCVFVYLFPKILDRLLPKFEQELKPGSIVVSCDFKFSKREPSQIIDLPSTKLQINKKLFIYKF